MLSVREAPDVQIAVDDAKERWARADEAWEAVTWTLARDPTFGEPLNESGHTRAFTFVGAWAYEMPTIVVVYDFDKQYVTIRSVRFQDAQPGQVGWA